MHLFGKTAINKPIGARYRRPIPLAGILGQESSLNDTPGKAEKKKKKEPERPRQRRKCVVTIASLKAYLMKSV